MGGPDGRGSQAGGWGAVEELGLLAGLRPQPVWADAGDGTCSVPEGLVLCPPCPPASSPPLASLPWALALALSRPPDIASSSSDAYSGLRFFRTHHFELLFACLMLGEQGELGRGLVGEAAKHHVHSRPMSSSSFFPRAPAWSSWASPATLLQAPGLSPHRITPGVTGCLVWTTLLSIWPVKSSCGPHAGGPVCPELPSASSAPSLAAPTPLERSQSLWGNEPRLTAGVWSQEEGSLKQSGRSRHFASSQPAFRVVSEGSAWNLL